MIYAVIVGGSILVALCLIGLVFSRLYTRASPEKSFVRSGFGGRKVVMTSGALVIPILHETIAVNMKTMRLEIERRDKESLITKDKLRVDTQVAFFTRVRPTTDAIAMAAQTLGMRTQDSALIKELVEPKFANALRDVAAKMTMSELQHNRGDFVQQVLESVASDLEKNGLELESVSLTSLDQTSKEHFNENNIFDSEGLTEITKQTEQRRKERNDIEQETAVAIRNRNYEAEREQLRISQEEEEARLSQQREVEYLKADQEAAIAQRQAEQTRNAEEARIASNREVENARISAEKEVETQRITKDRAIKEADIDRARQIEIAEQTKQIAVSVKSQEESDAAALADKKRAEAVKAAEEVTTVRETAQANRAKEVAVIRAKQEAEEDAVAIAVAAEADKRAAIDKAEGQITLAEAQRRADELYAEGAAAKYQADAEGDRLLNEAANLLGSDQISMRVRLAMIEALPAILREQLKPIEKVGSIKVLSMPQGAGFSQPGGAVQGGSGSGDVTQNLLNSMLEYRMKSPVVDSILKELDLTGDATLSDSLSQVLSAPKSKAFHSSRAADDKSEDLAPDQLA